MRLTDAAKVLTMSLCDAIQSGNKKEMLKLLKEVEEIDYGEGYTSLHVAAMAVGCGYTKVAELLLDKRGADVNARNIHKETPLHSACMSLNGDVEMITLLLDKGADIHARMWDGSTPLHCACAPGFETVVELLLEKGADINAESNCGTTPLYTASSYGHEKLTMLLLRKGADVNTQDCEGETPLWGAMYFCMHLKVDENSNDISIIKILVENGANVNSKNNDLYDGLTPLHFASNSGHEELVQYLLETGANVNAEDDNGNTPLHEVFNTKNPNFCADGYKEVVKLLLVEGADVNAKNNDGFTPLDLAKKDDDDSLISLLTFFKHQPFMENGEESSQKCDNPTTETNQSSQMAIVDNSNGPSLIADSHIEEVTNDNPTTSQSSQVPIVENSNEPSLIVDSHIEEVTTWLLTFLREVDAIKYRDCFIEKGFDTIEIVKQVVEESDLDFMKIGHRRMTMAKLLELREE